MKSHNLMLVKFFDSSLIYGRRNHRIQVRQVPPTFQNHVFGPPCPPCQKVCLSTRCYFQSTVSQIQSGSHWNYCHLIHSTFSLGERPNQWKSAPGFHCYFTDSMQSAITERTHRAPAPLTIKDSHYNTRSPTVHCTSGVKWYIRFLFPDWVEFRLP